MRWPILVVACVDDFSCTARSARVTRREVRVRKVPVGSES